MLVLIIHAPSHCCVLPRTLAASGLQGLLSAEESAREFSLQLVALSLRECSVGSTAMVEQNSLPQQLLCGVAGTTLI